MSGLYPEPGVTAKLDDRGQVLQIMAGVAGIFTTVLLVLVLVSSDRTSFALDLAVLITLLASCGLAWWLARNAQVSAGSHLLFVSLALLTLASSLEDGAASVTIPTLFLPIVGATLLLRPQWSFGYAGLAIAIYIFLSLFRTVERPASSGDLVSLFAINITLYSAYFFIVALLAYLAAAKLTRALATSRDDNAQLTGLRHSLEQQVAARTASLQEALAEVQERETRLSTALDNLRQSETTIRELSAPVLPVLPGVLVLPLIGTIDSERAEMMMEQALRTIEQRRAHTFVFDVTGVPLIDTRVAQVLLQTAEAVKLIGARVVLVGIRPEVAQTLVALQVDLYAFEIASDLQQALGLILRRTGKPGPDASQARELDKTSRLAPRSRGVSEG